MICCVHVCTPIQLDCVAVPVKLHYHCSAIVDILEKTSVGRTNSLILQRSEQQCELYGVERLLVVYKR